VQEARIFTRIPLEEGNASGRNGILAVFGQHLYLGVVAHRLDAMSTLDGALLWQRQVGLPLGETLLEANGVVYIPSGISIDALNVHDGTRLWSRDADPDWSFGTPLFVHNVLFVAEQPVPLPARIPHSEGSSTLFALNAGNGFSVLAHSWWWRCYGNNRFGGAFPWQERTRLFVPSQRIRSFSYQEASLPICYKAFALS
jgi:outer membrane protein assembly factor BamB